MYKYKRDEVTRKSGQETETVLWGYIVIALGVFVLVLGLYTLVISKVLPYTGITLLDWIKEDFYYSALSFVMVPVTIIFIYFNWLGMKFFRHN